MSGPTPEQMRLAAAWLECNEGDGSEAADCAAVAAWLQEQANAAEFRAECARAGVKVSAARRRIAALNAEPQS